MASDIEKAVKVICEEKGISEEAVITTIEAALAAAYRKDFAEKIQNIKVRFNLKTGEAEVFDVKTVVEDLPEEEVPTTEGVGIPTSDQDQDVGKDRKDKKISEASSESPPDSRAGRPSVGKGVGIPSGAPSETEKTDQEQGVEEEPVKRFNPKTDIELKEAVKIKPGIKVDEELKTQLTVPEAYGRMAAQTAKQVIIQKLREAERDTLYDEFKGKEHTVVMATVQRREIRNVLVDIGRLTAIMPKEEQIERENYRTGDRIKVYILSVTSTNKGPEVIISRASDEIVYAVFKNEIPEIANGVIEIKAVAREAGARSKVAVFTSDPNIDPIGSCVGQRGTRVQTIITELGGEKIDIIQYDEDPSKYIAHALAPAKPLNIEIKEKTKSAVVSVENDQLSLAIGRSGQNVRLASKLTGWKIDIKSSESGEVIDSDTEHQQENKGNHASIQPTSAPDGQNEPDAEVGKEKAKKDGDRNEELAEETKEGVSTIKDAPTNDAGENSEAEVGKQKTDNKKDSA